MPLYVPAISRRPVFQMDTGDSTMRGTAGATAQSISQLGSGGKRLLFARASSGSPRLHGHLQMVARLNLDVTLR